MGLRHQMEFRPYGRDDTEVLIVAEVAIEISKLPSKSEVNLPPNNNKNGKRRHF